jgi:hypothetical protein
LRLAFAAVLLISKKVDTLQKICKCVKILFLSFKIPRRDLGSAGLRRGNGSETLVEHETATG